MAIRTELTTNATLLSQKKGEQLLDSNLDYLRISINSVNQRRHETITQSKIQISKIHKNVSNFHVLRNKFGRNRPFIYVKMIDSFSISENTNFLKMYKDVADEVMIEKPMNWNDYEKRDLISTLYDYNDSLTHTLNEKQKNIFPYPKKICPFPFYTLIINANGDVTICCVDWNKKTKVGNVTESSLHEIWHSDILRDFRRMHIEWRRHENESCHNCTYLFTSPDNLDRLSAERYNEILL